MGKVFCKDCASFYSTGETSINEYFLTNDDKDKGKMMTPPNGAIVVHCQHPSCFEVQETQKPNPITGYEGLSKPEPVRVQGCAQLNCDFNCPNFKKSMKSAIKKAKSKKKEVY